MTHTEFFFLKKPWPGQRQGKRGPMSEPSRLELLENLVAKQQERLARLEVLVIQLTRGAEGPAARSIAAAVAAGCCSDGPSAGPPLVDRVDPAKGLSDSTRILTEAYQNRLALMSEASEGAYRPNATADGAGYNAPYGNSVETLYQAGQLFSPPKPQLAPSARPASGQMRPRSEEGSRLVRRPQRVEEAVSGAGPLGSHRGHAPSPDVPRRARPLSRESQSGGGTVHEGGAERAVGVGVAQHRPASGLGVGDYSAHPPGEGSRRPSPRGSEGLLTRPIASPRGSLAGCAILIATDIGDAV